MADLFAVRRFLRPNTYVPGSADMTLHPADGDVVFPVPRDEATYWRPWMRLVEESARRAARRWVRGG
jgi:hypothetical protein